MLRLFGGIVLIILIVGPLLMQAGYLPHEGLFHEFVDLELRTIDQFIVFARGLLHREA